MIRHTPPHRRRSRGFTLVELMVVMGIIVMVLGMGIPIFAVLMQGQSIQGAVGAVEGAFVRFREEASARGQPVFLVFEHWRVPPRLQAWTITKDDTTGNYIYSPDEPIEFPEHSWANEDWIDELAEFSSISSTIPYSNQANHLMTEEYGMPNPDGNASWIQEIEAEDAGLANDIRDWMDQPYIIIFLPDGGLELIGRANVPSYELELDPPNLDADIILTNLSDREAYIDLNPATGRTRSRILDIE